MAPATSLPEWSKPAMAEPGPFTVVETLHQGRTGAVSRVRLDASERTAILKQRHRRLCSEAELERLHNEHKVLAGLDVAGLPQVLDWLELEAGPAILFADRAARPLSQCLAPARPWHDWLEFALRLARLLGRLHEAGVTHRQLAPEHVLVSDDDGAPILIGFSHASTLAREQATWDTARLALAHLPYIAPEQTGRINRSIDYRSDFYSLGCTLYELFAGRPPFSGDDPLALVHCHIARPPPPPHQIDRELPQAISAIVLKLLAKDAAERYQSAAGICRDLERCLAQWQRSARIDAFEAGTQDTCARFEIPRRLYGREELLRELTTGYDRCAAGGQMLVLVSGHTGVGKSSLVDALHEYVSRSGGRLCSGKFDQFRRDRPYSAVIQALQGLVREVLAEPEERVEACRRALSERVGNSISALLKLIPELRHIAAAIDPALAPVALDEQSRYRLFTQLLGVLAGPGQPLVLFLDDLQWADLASLQLLESLARTPSLPGLLLIGSFRDDELRPEHPLVPTLERLRALPIALRELRIQPLLLRPVTRLIADTLRCSEHETAALARICHQKTQGNPFFLSQFLHSLHDQGLIRFRADRWEWDEAAIGSRELADNVVSLMVGKIQRLPARAQKVLPMAACIGGVFDLRTLAVANRRSVQETADDLWPALAEGLVAAVDDRYRVLEASDPGQSRYRFVHDRIQQAAYSLIEERDFKALHLLIGEQMLARMDDDEIDQRIFEVTNHLNLARELIGSEAMRLRLAELDLRAGRRAKDSAAFDSALEYLRTGLALLPADGWERCYPLALELHLAATEVANIRMDFAWMESLIAAIDANARTLIDRVRTYEIRIQSEVSRNRFPQALATAIEVLALLGVRLPQRPDPLQIRLGLLRTRLLLRRMPGERIVRLGPMREPRMLAALPILGSLFGVVKFSSSALRPLVMARQVELTLRHGLTPYAASAFAGYGGVLCGQFDAIDEGYRIGRLGLTIEEHHPSPSTRHKTLSLFNCYVRHYKEPLRNSLDGLLDAYRAALECGDLEYAAYSIAAHIQYAFLLSTNLSELQTLIARHVAQLREWGQKQSLQYSVMALQTVANLRGQCADPLTLDGDFYAEEPMLAEHRRENHRTAICVHHFYKTLLALLFGQHEAAIAQAAQCIEYLPYVSGTTVPSWITTLQALALLGRTGTAARREQAMIRARVGANLRRLRRWARHCAANNEHRVLVVEAELLRVRGRSSEAAERYELAIRQAERNGFALEAAMACELAARFHHQAGHPVLARTYLAETWRRFRAWGASAKLDHLLQSHPGRIEGLDGDGTQRPSAPLDPAGNASALSNQAFDITSVIRASQAISDEIVLERLLGQLMRLALTNAGAQRAIMVLNRQGRLHIEAEAGVDEATRVFSSLRLEGGHDHLPVSIVNYVARTKETVVLDDAPEQPLFRHDKYIRSAQPRSLLCMPILYHGELTAVLYLEHAGSPSVFDQTRLETLKILAAQAAISIENAKLYEDLQQSEQEYRSLFENAIEGIFRVNPEGRFLSANPALARMLGYDSCEDFLGAVTDVSRQCFIDQDDLRRFLGTLQIRNRVLGFETRWLRRDRDPVYVSISARRVLDAEQNLVYYEGSLTDISERKDKEHAELAREKAEAASEAKSQFLATMSHEIRTPLNGILGMAQILMRSALQPAQHEQVDAIRRSGEALLAILNDVLDFTKIEAGQLELERHPFAPAELIAELQLMLGPIAARQSLDLIVETDPRLPERLLGDRRALTQILMNLATNALKFTPAGFVALRTRVLDAADGRVRLRFEVEDSGIGIAEDAHERIFAHFSQADSSITRRFGGTGLGLSICRKLVLLQDGLIDFSSAPGRGSLFRVELEYPVTSALPEPTAEPGRALRPLEILLVEDTEINQQVTRGLLESEGHTVAIADDGYTALSMHNDRDYDLILMDIHLPGMDGLETTRRMRAHRDPRKAAVRIVALTASIAPSQVSAYLASGIDAVVGKPVRFEELARTLADPHHSTARPPAPPPHEPGPESSPLLDTRLLAEHRSQLGDAQFAALLVTLEQQLEEILTALRSAATHRNTAEQAALLHKLAGACSNFGLAAAAAETHRLETLTATDEPIPDLEPLEALIRESLQKLTRNSERESASA